MHGWLRACAEDATRQERRLLLSVTVNDALGSLPIFSYPQKGLDEDQVAVVIDTLLARFCSLLNLARPLKPEQISELTDYVLTDYNDLSLEALQHCLNCLLKKQEPFTKVEFFQSLDVQQMLQLLGMYREYMIITRENRHTQAKADHIYAQEAIIDCANKYAPEMAQKWGEIINQHYREKAASQNRAWEKHQQQEKERLDAMITGWRSEYRQLESPTVTEDEYVRFHLESYQEARKRLLVK